MLEINIPAQESWDEANNKFVKIKATTLMLEHSLLSISKWEMKFKKPFLSKDQKTGEEVLYYVKCMTLNTVDDYYYNFLTRDNLESINAYISDSMTATWFNERDKKPAKRSSEQITSELIYYWMSALQIPFSCENWHLNRLMTLIRIANIKNNAESDKMSPKDIAKRNRSLNAARRNKFHTKG